MIEVKDLRKTFGSTTALDGITFSVSPGEVVGLLGPNGAGKSTTMRIMTGYMAADGGSVSVDGDRVDVNTIGVQARIGYLPENNPLYKDMLVSDLINFSAEVRRIPKNKRKQAIDSVTEACGIGEVFHRPIRELSKGYKQRTGLALALLHRPDIVILDEPTEGLDPNQRAEIRALIKDLSKDRTIIISTHVMQEATAVCGRVLVLNAGKLVADGTPEDLARASRGALVVAAEFEGRDVKESLERENRLRLLEAHMVGDVRYRVRVESSDGSDIQEVLSKLIQEKRWVVRRLIEEEGTLEDVFSQLTSDA